MGISISIDGPTASGKTTLAAALAGVLDVGFLDTGLAYRGLAYALAHESLDPAKAPLGSFLAHEIRSAIDHDGTTDGNPNGRSQAVLYRGVDISDALYANDLDATLRDVSGDVRWRTQVLEMHKGILKSYEAPIAVGRDVATHLLKDASISVFLTAAQFVRRERRRAQYRTLTGRSIAVGHPSSRDNEVEQYVRALPNGLVIDSTYLPRQAVLDVVVRALGGRGE